MKGRCGPAKSSPETLSSSVNSVMNFGKAEVGGAFRSCQAVFLAIVTATLNTLNHGSQSWNRIPLLHFVHGCCHSPHARFVHGSV